MTFLFYYIIARIRGIRRNYNILLDAPSVSCGIHRFSEIRTMYKLHGWVPYCITSKGSSYIV